MKASISHPLPARSLVQACSILGLVIFALVLVAAAYGYSLHQLPGVWAALVAGLVLGVPTLAALVLTITFGGEGPQAVTGLLGGVILRTAVPFGGLIFLPQAFPWLKDAGFPAMILGMFLPVLGLETILAVRLMKQRSAAKKNEIENGSSNG